MIEIIRRHPLRDDELLATLQRYVPDQVRQTLAVLETSGQTQRIVYRGQTFWEYTGRHSHPMRQPSEPRQALHKCGNI